MSQNGCHSMMMSVCRFTVGRVACGFVRVTVGVGGRRRQPRSAIARHQRYRLQFHARCRCSGRRRTAHRLPARVGHVVQTSGAVAAPGSAWGDPAPRWRRQGAPGATPHRGGGARERLGRPQGAMERLGRLRTAVAAPGSAWGDPAPRWRHQGAPGATPHRGGGARERVGRPRTAVAAPGSTTCRSDEVPTKPAVCR